MNIHILTLFPESMVSYLESSMMKRAQEKGLFHYILHNLTDWTVRNTRRVDDKPYGGWPGTLLTIEPLTRAIEDIWIEYGKMPILYPSPRWELLDHDRVDRFSQMSNSYLIICGHYEGIDERIFELFPVEEFSIGEYVLSSWELGALVWIDSVIRLIPGVLSAESLREESFSQWLDGQKEYPQYSRPENFRWLSVPDILLSGDKKRIHEWNQAHRKI